MHTRESIKKLPNAEIQSLIAAADKMLFDWELQIKDRVLPKDLNTLWAAAALLRSNNFNLCLKMLRLCEIFRYGPALGSLVQLHFEKKITLLPEQVYIYAKRAVDANPNDIVALIRLSQCYLDESIVIPSKITNRAGEAYTTVAQALMIDPTHVEVLSRLVNLHRNAIGLPKDITEEVRINRIAFFEGRLAEAITLMKAKAASTSSSASSSAAIALAMQSQNSASTSSASPSSESKWVEEIVKRDKLIQSLKKTISNFKNQIAKQQDAIDRAQSLLDRRNQEDEDKAEADEIIEIDGPEETYDPNKKIKLTRL